ncbi:MAG: hypothetical protein JXI43_14570 [Tissierellales bacterium]|nr:hypothetical protein [Tissierellales bacterium]
MPISLENVLPVLWICEIKYNYGIPSQQDIAKLKTLLLQDKINHGCCLNINRAIGKQKRDLTQSIDPDSKLWLYDVMLPLKVNSSGR